MDDQAKMTRSILVRCEDELYEFYKAKAKRRHVSMALVVRELMYREKEAEDASKKKGNDDGDV